MLKIIYRKVNNNWSIGQILRGLCNRTIYQFTKINSNEKKHNSRNDIHDQSIKSTKLSITEKKQPENNPLKTQIV